MASRTITIPEFDFSGMYYPQLIESLMRYKRINLPELTDESDVEPSVQLNRAFAIVGHLNSVMLDMLANESTLPTARLVAQVRAMLRLIDYRMSPASPAQVDILYKLVSSLASSIEVVPEGAQAATRRSADSPAVPFEANAAITATRTDQIGYVYVDESGTFTDQTTAARTTGAGDDFALWATPAVADAIYFGHDSVMWNLLTLVMGSDGSDFAGVWEFYAGDYLIIAPTSVTQMGGSLRVVVDAMLGTDQRPGGVVRVTLNSTGAFEEATVEWDGSNNYVDVGLLGQSSPSEEPDDYTIGAEWMPFDMTSLAIDDGSVGLTTSGDLAFDVPQDATWAWAKSTVNATEAYWLRFRITQILSEPATSPELRSVAMDDGDLYVLGAATQGQTAVEDPLASSTGLPDQRHETGRDNFILNSQIVTVDDEEWAEVDNFLNSEPQDKHYMVELGDDDRATIVFGSGVNGKVPPAGANNIGITYRHGASEDGNVGPQTVIVDKTGLTYVDSLTNPRQAVGWQEAEGASEASLERAKIAGPASIRARDVALSPDDVAELVKAYEDDNGSRPFARAKVIEEGLGPKTLEVIVVAKGGGLASSEQLAALDAWLNGDEDAGLPKRIVANQEATSFNYTTRVINVVATATSEASAEQMAARLEQILQPDALREDGITYEWKFGATIAVSRLNHEIFDVDDTTTAVDVATPAADVVLGARELPVAGTISITVTEP